MAAGRSRLSCEPGVAMRDTFGALDAWFRSGASGAAILVLLVAGTLLYGCARLTARRITGSRITRVLDAIAFAALILVGILFIIGGPLNE